MAVSTTAVLRASISQNSQHRKTFFFEEWQHLVIQQISGSDRCLSRVQLAVGHLAVGVHNGLLVDSADTLQSTDVEGVLGTEVARMDGFDLATSFIIQLLSLKRLDLRFGQNDAVIPPESKRI